jgi:predicted dehydrogenase
VPVYNYGVLQVAFDDGSVGWYEAGWGPMMSETAFFVKDVIGPGGAVSIVMEEGGSADVDTHTRTSRIRVHRAERRPDGGFARPDDLLSTADEPGHQALCDREQAFLARAILEDIDLSRHNEDAVRSLEIVLAAEVSMRERRSVHL